MDTEDQDLAATLRRAREAGIDPRRVALALGVEVPDDFERQRTNDPVAGQVDEQPAGRGRPS